MASALWSQIDMTATDGGLDKCLKVANVAATLVANLKDVRKMVTLRGFATSYTEEAGSDGIKDYVKEIDKIWQADAAEGFASGARTPPQRVGCSINGHYEPREFTSRMIIQSVASLF